MRNDLLEMFGVSLVMTIALELTAVFGCTQLRKKYGLPETADSGSAGGPKRGSAGGPGRAGNGGLLPALQGRNGFLLVILVNVLTNPAAVLLCWLSRSYMPQIPQMPVQLAVEAVVVSVEAWIYCRFAKEEGWKIDHPVFLSVAANLCSWLTGMLVQAAKR
ncbi:MAG: hypothetical protein NC254_00520 [bacterium]|nr:hypothetical protein [bacterium]